MKRKLTKQLSVIEIQAAKLQCLDVLLRPKVKDVPNFLGKAINRPALGSSSKPATELQKRSTSYSNGKRKGK